MLQPEDLNRVIRELREQTLKPWTTPLSRRAYDEMDLMFAEQCSHGGRDVCSLCKTERS